MAISTFPRFMILATILSMWAVGMAAAVNKTSVTCTGLTAYECLEAYNLPVGLLPLGVIGYDIDEDTGEVSVYLGEVCIMSQAGGTYNVKLQPTITGYVETGTIYDFGGCAYLYSGVYLDMIKVVRSGSILIFSIGGILTVEFPVADFSESVECDSALKYLGGRRSGILQMPH